MRDRGLAAQLGGAAGTLASLGESGLSVLGEFARELELAEPTVPWHTDRTRIAEIGGSLSLVAGVLGKISLDVILMAQTEVGEVTEPADEGRGGSSTLPHKRNPILSVTAAANTRRVQALAQTLYGAMAGEHERAAGAWHAEWEALSDALALTGGAAAAVREVTEGLEVHPEKMRQNLDETGGMLWPRTLRRSSLIASGAWRPTSSWGRPPGGPQMVAGRSAMSFWRSRFCANGSRREEIDAALDPRATSALQGTFIDRALSLYREEVQT